MSSILVSPLSRLRGERSFSQMPPIGIIDFYGINSLNLQTLYDVLPISIGDTLKGYPKQAEQIMLTLPNVEKVKFEPVCCDAGKTILYVGLQQRGEPTLTFLPSPTGNIALPPDIQAASDSYGKAMIIAVQKGDASEDHRAGHALSKNTGMRAIQEQYIKFATRDLRLLRTVLHQSKDAEQRAIAAQVIAYAPAKQSIVPDLVQAMRDSDTEVRNNATRALWAMDDYVPPRGGHGIAIPPAPFIDLLNSLEWTDRNKGSLALFVLTAKRDHALLAALRNRAYTSLTEMARWKSAGHAIPAFTILGRIGGLSESEIQAQWQKRNPVEFIKYVETKINPQAADKKPKPVKKNR